MGKLKMILMFTLPAIRGAANYLRFKDGNSEGKDDQAADALTFAADFVESLAYGTPTPDLPKSLRPKPEVTDTAPLPDAPA